MQAKTHLKPKWVKRLRFTIVYGFTASVCKSSQCYALTGSTGGEVSLMSERGGWITGGCISCSARFSLLFSGFVGLNRGFASDMGC